MAAVLLLQALPRRAGRALARAQARCLSSPDDDQMTADLANRDRIVKARSRSVTPPHIAVVPDGLAPAGPANPSEVASIMRIPEIHKNRTVVISQRAQASTTSASHASKSWRLSWKTEERWTNPLMGWTSTADPLSNAELKFETAEQAERFATKMGWPCEVNAPIVRNKVYGTNTYSHNFLQKWVETDLKQNGLETRHFHKPHPNASHYFRPLKFHGDGECIQHGHRVPGSKEDADHAWKRKGSPGEAWTKKAATAPGAAWAFPAEAAAPAQAAPAKAAPKLKKAVRKAARNQPPKKK